MKTLDLLDASEMEIARAVQNETDPETLRLLMDLEEATRADDLDAKGAAVEKLVELLVLQRGLGWGSE